MASPRASWWSGRPRSGSAPARPARATRSARRRRTGCPARTPRAARPYPGRSAGTAARAGPRPAPRARRAARPRPRPRAGPRGWASHPSAGAVCATLRLAPPRLGDLQDGVAGAGLPSLDRMVSHPSPAPAQGQNPPVSATRLLAPLRAVGPAALWLGGAHLLLDAVFGLETAFLMLYGLFFSVVLLPFALLGVPVWILTAWVSNGLAFVERARYRALLGVTIDSQPMPPAQRHLLRYGGALWRDEGVRRRALHQVVALPLGLLTTGVAYTVLAGGIGLLGTAAVL